MLRAPWQQHLARVAAHSLGATQCRSLPANSPSLSHIPRMTATYMHGGLRIT